MAASGVAAATTAVLFQSLPIEPGTPEVVVFITMNLNCFYQVRGYDFNLGTDYSALLAVNNMLLFSLFITIILLLLLLELPLYFFVLIIC